MSSLALTCVLLVIARGRGRGLDPLMWWAISIGCGAVGALIFAIPLPLLLTQDLSRLLLIGTTVTSWNAARVFTFRKPLPVVALAGPLIWTVVCLIPGLDGSNHSVIVLFGIIGLFYRVLTVLTLWNDGGEHLPSRPVALAILIGHAVLYGMRPLLSVVGAAPWIDQAYLNVLVFEAQLYAIGMAFVLIAMTKERAEREAAANLEAAKRAEAARAEFLTRMTHEIRTPLMGMLSLAKLLGRDPNLRPDHRNLVETLEAAEQYLLAIVSEALGYSNQDRASQVARKFDPARTIDGCLALVRQTAAEKRIRLGRPIDPGTPDIVIGDQLRLRQILLSLLWIAIRATPDGGSVTVGVKTLARDNTDGDTAVAACFEVRHTAPRGMQNDEEAHVSAPAAISNDLALSAELALAMGAVLTSHPNPGGTGRLFRLAVPWPAEFTNESLRAC